MHAENSLTGLATYSCSDNLLKFICEFQHEPGPLQMYGEEDDSVCVSYESVSVILPAQCSVNQLRLRICMQVCIPQRKDKKQNDVLKRFFLIILATFCAYIAGFCNLAHSLVLHKEFALRMHSDKI